MQKTKTKNKLLAFFAIVAGTLLLATALIFWNPLEKWQLKLTNRFYDRNEPSEDIVIVAIDENTLAAGESEWGRWGTWDRTIYGQVVENLEAKGATVIAFDVFFIEKSQGISESALKSIIAENPTFEEYRAHALSYLAENHPSDLAFAEILSKYDNVILPNKAIDVSGQEGQGVYPLEILRENAETAWILTYPDEDDLMRRVYPNFYDTSKKEWGDNISLKIYKILNGEEPANFPEHLNEDGTLLINYAAPPFSYPMIPFVDAYNGFIDEEDVKGKVVFIGVVAYSLKDIFPTPTDHEFYMPGVELRANELQTLLEENFLFEQSKPSQLLTIAALTILLTAAVMALGILPGLFAAIALIAGYHLAAEPIFDRGLIVNLVYPTIALFTAYLATTLYKYLTETKEKQELKSAFGKYVNKDLVEQIIEHPEQLKLGGDRRTVTVFFSDIENFTHFSEQSTPEVLVAQLNEYFEVMTDIVLQRGGTLDKFEGDAIMAFWGAPLPQPEHAQRAAESALACRAALADLHARWQTEGKPLLNFRVGLATGDAIAGNIGSRERFDYTVMGDIVNLGARLEGANKEYGTRIMVSQATADALRDRFELRCLDRLRVKGKDNAIEIYELMSAKGQLAPEHHALVEGFQTALNFYFQGDFEEAETRFRALAEKIPHDGPTQMYLKRCAALKVNRPTDWQGVWTLEHK